MDRARSRVAAQSGGYFLEGDVLVAARRYVAAADTLAAAFEREPTWPVLSRLLGAYQLAEKPEEALAVTREWVAANPQHSLGVLALAGLLQNAERKDEALLRYHAVIDIDGENVAALNNAAWLSHELDRAGAVELAERARALAPDNPAVLDTLGWVLLGEGRGAEAIPHLSRAAELAPDAPELRYHLASALAANGQLEEARSLLRDVVADAREFEGKADARRLLESL